MNICEIIHNFDFSYFQNLAPGRLPDPWSDLADLGDIFLGMPYIQRKCDEENSLESMIPVSMQPEGALHNTKCA